MGLVEAAEAERDRLLIAGNVQPLVEFAYDTKPGVTAEPPLVNHAESAAGVAHPDGPFQLGGVLVDSLIQRLHRTPCGSEAKEFHHRPAWASVKPPRSVSLVRGIARRHRQAARARGAPRNLTRT